MYKCFKSRKQASNVGGREGEKQKGGKGMGGAERGEEQRGE
jgi:hypothetical protein